MPHKGEAGISIRLSTAAWQVRGSESQYGIATLYAQAAGAMTTDLEPDGQQRFGGDQYLNGTSCKPHY